MPEEQFPSNKFPTEQEIEDMAIAELCRQYDEQQAQRDPFEIPDGYIWETIHA